MMARLWNFVRRLTSWAVVSIVVIFLLLAVTIGVLIAVYTPEKLPNQVGETELNPQGYALRNPVTGPTAIEQYEQAFERKEADFTRSAESQIGPISPVPPIFGGNVEVIQLEVLTPGDNRSDLETAHKAVQGMTELIRNQAKEKGLDVAPSLNFVLKAPSVATISSNPSQVAEADWMREAASNLGVACSPSEHPWTCLLSWAQEQKSPEAQSAVLVILLNDMPLLPGQTYQIDGYARQLGMVISAQSGFVSAGLGDCFVAHEFLHGYSVKHPGQPLETFGYWGVLNISRNDLMHQISRCSVSRESFETAGLRDENRNSVADVHDTDFHFANLQVNEDGVSGTVEDTPYPVSPFSLYQPYNFHRITAVEVRINGGQWKLATPIGSDWGEQWQVEFQFAFGTPLDISRQNRIEVRAITDFPQLQQPIVETVLIGRGEYNVYLPFIR